MLKHEPGTLWDRSKAIREAKRFAPRATQRTQPLESFVHLNTLPEHQATYATAVSFPSKTKVSCLCRS